MPEVFTHSIRVRYGECDPQGVVFNANWLAYYDIVMTELWRELVGDYSGMVEQGADMMVAEAAVRFRGPARFDDVIVFELSVTRLGETALGTRVEGTVEGSPVVEATMRHVFVDPGTTRKRPIPDEVRAALEPLLAANPAAATAQQ
jgi:acyl-CoA thioester hydrolase